MQPAATARGDAAGIDRGDQLGMVEPCLVGVAHPKVAIAVSNWGPLLTLGPRGGATRAPRRAYGVGFSVDGQPRLNGFA
jgi:hypothetical protein